MKKRTTKNGTCLAGSRLCRINNSSQDLFFISACKSFSAILWKITLNINRGERRREMGRIASRAAFDRLALEKNELQWMDRILINENDSAWPPVGFFLLFIYYLFSFYSGDLMFASDFWHQFYLMFNVWFSGNGFIVCSEFVLSIILSSKYLDKYVL